MQTVCVPDCNSYMSQVLTPCLCCFPGPAQIPHQFLDIYLRPLYKELMLLWRGVQAIDGSVLPGRTSEFVLHAALFCTMHDWPGW